MGRYSRNIFQWNGNDIKSRKMTTGDYSRGLNKKSMSILLWLNGKSHFGAQISPQFCLKGFSGKSNGRMMEIKFEN